MLKASGFTLPRRIQVHGMLTVNGEKMSKSKGMLINAATYLEHLDPAYLRYYYASKLSGKLDDLDLDLDEFVAKVNSDLVGKVVNLASRTASFVAGARPGRALSGRRRALRGRGAASDGDRRRVRGVRHRARDARHHGARRSRQRVRRREAAVGAEEASPTRPRELRDVCTVALNLFRQIVVYLAPVLPKLAEQAGELLCARRSPVSTTRQAALVGTTVREFSHMMQRVDPKKIEAVVAAVERRAAEAAERRRPPRPSR